MTTSYRVFALMSKGGEWSTITVAKALRLTDKQAESAFSNLRRHGRIVRTQRIGKSIMYRVAVGAVMVEDGRGQTQGSAAARRLGPGSKPKVVRCLTRPSERRDDIDPANGYGWGKIALEMAWR